MEPVPLQRASADEVMAHFTKDWPEHLHSEIGRAMRASIDSLLKQAVEGDELWLCRSRYVGPLAGHEGFGLVRAGAILRYERVRNY